MLSALKVIFRNYSLGQALRAELEEDVGFLVRSLPGILGFGLRYMAYKPLFGRILSMPMIYPGARFVFMKNICLGRNVIVNSNTYIYARGSVEIGDKVLIAPNCAIVAGDHDIRMISDSCIMDTPSSCESIVIEDGCWIGANAVILSGVRLGAGSVVGAGAVVTKDTEPNSINLGVPAKKTGQRPLVE